MIRHAIALLLAVMCADRCIALEADRRLDQLQHTAWTASDGAPTEIVAITQTNDGFLMLATPSGLYRFDGVVFERVDIFPKGAGLGQVQDISALTVDRDGALWIGLRVGGVLRWTGSAESSIWYGPEAGLPPARTVFGVVQDIDGQVWAATSSGLFTLSGERWHRVGKGDGLDAQFTGMVTEEPDGTLWVGAENYTWFTRRHGATRFERSSDMQGKQDVAFSKSGRRWTWDATGHLVLGTPTSAQLAWPIGADRGGSLADRDGGVWVYTFGRGIRRLPTPDRASQPPDSAALESMDRRGGLSGDVVNCGFQDRDGTVWFGTATGLDRFRVARAIPAPFEFGLAAGVLVALNDGSVMAGSTQGLPTQLSSSGPPKSIPGDYRRAETHFGAAWSDPSGAAWLGGYPDIWQFKDGAMQRIPAPSDVPPMFPVQAIGQDAEGQLWATWIGSGLRRLTVDGWERPSAQTQHEFVVVVQTDEQKGFWRGLGTGEVIRRDAIGERRFGPAEGLNVGIIMSIHAHGGRVWVGGESGAAQLVKGRFRRLDLEDGPAPRVVSGIVESTDGDVWLNDASGILRLRRADLLHWENDTSFAIPAERLDWRDGVLGSSPQLRGLPNAALGKDGILWFSRGSGIYWIDPARTAPVVTIPTVLVTRISADDRPLPTSSEENELPPGPQAVRISYTAPVPGTPDHIRFRHRLVGLDTKWQPATDRREAVFTHLPPGSYRFEVQAMDTDRWQSPVSSFKFSIQPAFYQTLLFRLAVAAVAVTVWWLIYRWRLASKTRQIRERIEERLSERERIARELHDTLLQSTLALTVQVEDASLGLSEADPMRKRFAAVLDQADAAMVEARERVQDLRRHQQSQELSLALKDAVLVLRGTDDTPDIRAECIGRVRRLSTTAWHEVYRLGSEAAQNALRHAHATRLELVVRYDSDGLLLTVADDGVGMNVPDYQANASRLQSLRDPFQGPNSVNGVAASEPCDGEERGHFGLLGLYERARQLGGQLDIASKPGKGTEVRLRLRAAIAYPAEMSAWRRRLLALHRREADHV